jgi:hypothetical protein
VIFGVFVIFLSVRVRAEAGEEARAVRLCGHVSYRQPGTHLGRKRCRHLRKIRAGFEIVQVKNFFMVYSEAISAGRKNEELVLKAFRKYMRIDDPRLLEGTYKIQFLDTIPLRPYPNEEAIQIQIDDLANPSAPKLKRARAADFIDASSLCQPIVG